MPHLRFRSVENEIVQKASEVLPSQLARIISTTEDNFTFEKIETHFFQKGNADNSYPFIEVFWFHRTQEVQDHAAICISDFITSQIGKCDVVVVFVEYEKNRYYENAKHF